MNLPNKLTLSRVIAIPFVMAGLLVEFENPSLNITAKYFALIVFVIATITDLYDGKIARKLKIVTPFGSFFDPIADKLLVSSVMICFVEMRILPAWIVSLIIFREFLISGLRIIGVRAGVDIPAGSLGKQKTVSQMVLIITILVYLAAQSSHGQYFKSLFISGLSLDMIINNILMFLMIWTIFATVISGYMYVKDHWYLIIDGAK